LFMYKIGIFTKLFFSLILFSLAVPVGAVTVSAPTIVTATETYLQGTRTLEVRGLAPADTDILIYVNLQVAGIARTSEEEGELSSFYYKQNKNLPGGSYQVTAVARDQESFVVSDFSAAKTLTETKPIIEKQVAPKVIPPTLLRSVVDSESSYNRPKLIGQALSGLRVEVYVDDVKDGQLLMDEDKGGTVQFEYVTNKTLSAGQHKVYLYAIDKENNRSERSNMIFVNVAGLDEGRIDTVPEIDIPVVDKMPSGEDRKNIDELEEILGYQPSTSTPAESGLIDEDKEKQSKVKLNLFVFFLFLAAIIIWIFWVNRELIKEKENDDDDKPSGGSGGPEEVLLGDVEKTEAKPKKNDVEYGLEKKKRELDVLDF
jgi:hypothetical protein